MNAEADVQPKHFLDLLGRLLDEWRQLGSNPVAPNSSWKPEDADAPVHAFLVLNRWAENPLAEVIESMFPDMAQQRCAVPDRLFTDRLDEAPCLVPLANEMTPGAAADLPHIQSVRAVLAGWLAFAWNQALLRLARQDLCAVVLSRLPASRIAAHWTDLGDQRPPNGGASVLFRYQDPRVMQRMWPLLTSSQRLHWLGPVEQWWALAQPWGAMPDGMHADWFHARRPAGPVASEGLSLHRFTAEQWHAAHAWGPANRIWRDYADHGVGPDRQPDAPTMLQLLADASQLGLIGVNAEDYVHCSWLHEASGGAPQTRDWRLPGAARVLGRVLQTLRSDPQARFATVFHLLTRG